MSRSLRKRPLEVEAPVQDQENLDLARDVKKAKPSGDLRSFLKSDRPTSTTKVINSSNVVSVKPKSSTKGSTVTSVKPKPSTPTTKKPQKICKGTIAVVDKVVKELCRRVKA